MDEFIPNNGGKLELGPRALFFGKLRIWEVIIEGNKRGFSLM